MTAQVVVATLKSTDYQCQGMHSLSVIYFKCQVIKIAALTVAPNSTVINFVSS